MTKGLVSIVTPVYNGASHLRVMLESVLAQTYDQIEMILVDDGSTDETVKVAQCYRQKFAARNFSYRIVRTAHQNASAAISQGLPFVTGEYLIWPDSDDVLEPESVRRRVTFLLEHPGYQCVRTQSYYVDAITGTPRPPEEQQGDLSKENLFWDILESNTYVCCGCYMLRTEPFFSIYPDRRIPLSDVGQNFQMLLPFMYRHPCPTIREPLYGVLVRKDSHSRKKLTWAEEVERYQHYETLADTIASLCHICDEPSQKRLLAWKLLRRYRLCLKHGRRMDGIRALVLLYQSDILSTAEILRKCIRLCLGSGRIGKTVTAWYYAVFTRGDQEHYNGS